MVRQADGSLRVFHNVCRHRGMALATEPRQALRSITCPRHGWSYALDGALRHTTHVVGEGQYRCPGFEASELGLVEVRSARWNDFVLVNLDGRAPPLREHIAPLCDLLDGIELEGLRLIAAWQHHYPGN
ncbi:aromatic ring-hydroxylating oxygenase subunit alpha [Roseateles toxinivorans]|uniref:Rieske-like 2Fe-2S protein n=1 Tax=Roseateles toxinivorans TaxID=270368 RepID=A0A4V3CSG4_9BURK|nr:Rieske (2Fe-2S) protein [Roseateles toxinivorans]TDP60432.1 Rieske-like 2Fe-2S protein [Roseateles toxinivorans]